MSIKKPYMLIIYGPTGVGKTDFALEIAQHTPCEIVNLDMGQLYTPLSIGTAKPEWRSMSTPHHLFDIVDEPRNVTVTEYRNRLLEVLNQIWKRGNLPILVGGSGFYLKSILFPPLAMPPENNSIEYTGDANELWQKLYAIDPQRAQQIHKNDMYRIKRALTIWQKTGKKPSMQAPVFNPPSPFTLLFLSRERQELYNRINIRVEQMLKMGWIDETKTLLNTDWEQFLKTKKIIGYDDIVTFLRGWQSHHDWLALVETIGKRTRNYAKRQHTFWNMLKKNIENELARNSWEFSKTCKIESLDLTLIDLSLYINQLLVNIQSHT